MQKFTGKERDAETGLDYFLARYYASVQGRFTSPDEFQGGIVDPFTGQQAGQPGALPYADITDPQTLNKYAYVRNNPLRYVDPDGHCPWCAGALWGIGVGVGSQLFADISTGQPVTVRKTIAAAVGGAIIGGTIGAGSELGVAVQVAIAGDAGVVGGLVERAIKSGGMDEAVGSPAQIVRDFGSSAIGQGGNKILEAAVTRLAGGAVRSLTGQLERARAPSRVQKIESRLEAASESLQLKKTAATVLADSAREAAERDRQQRTCVAGTPGCQ